VTLAADGALLPGASVQLQPGGRLMETDGQGHFHFTDLKPGEYTVLAHMHALTDTRKTVTVTAGQETQVDFALALSVLRESMTVTASGHEEVAAEAFQSVTSLDGYQLTGKSGSSSLGDLLDGETGIAKRSYGPGTTRPVVRGFDGDRVLILEDGMRTGTLSSQSGDHGEPMDTNDLERVEVVKGPATLLYGSNAMGGVVNVLTEHHIINQHPHEGLHYSITGVGGTTNAQGGGDGSFEYGHERWMVYGGGGGMRTGDYSTPLGKVFNSGTDLRQTKFGVGHYGDRLSLNTYFQHVDTNYGIPAESAADEAPTLKMRRNNVRLNGAWKEMGPRFEQLEFDLSYSDYNHKEIDNGQVGTQFFNKQFTWRGSLNQKKRGPLSGSFGLWGLHRDYKAVGDEALTPPVKQNAVAAFGLEELTFNRIRFQFGGRLEHNGYSPVGLESRSFTGMSGSAGVYLPLWRDGALVGNYMHSYRAPSLEELYNHGPHPGNLAYEVGDSALNREKADGFEVSLRDQSQRVRMEANVFRYQMHDFVYFLPTGQMQEGLHVYQYAQADARYMGAEARLQHVVKGPLWALIGFDIVDANLTTANRMNLPRIPPARGRVGLDLNWRGLSLRPELVLTNRQGQVAPNETSTAGSAVVEMSATYTITRQHTMHTFNVNMFNLTDQLYRNHLSFIKDFAPEMGRGVRFAYTIRGF
jgi:iron complex outermembrane receptor protein